jgi:hypothetical protein
MNGASGEWRADRSRRNRRRSGRSRFDYRRRHRRSLLFGRGRLCRFGGGSIRLRLGPRHGTPSPSILFRLRPFGALFGGHGHPALRLIFYGIGNVKSVVAAQLDGYVFVD